MKKIYPINFDLKNQKCDKKQDEMAVFHLKNSKQMSFQQNQSELSPVKVRYIEEDNINVQQVGKQEEEQPMKNKIEWKATWHNRFIQFWQNIFNRRVFSFSSFTIQFGDIVIFLFLLSLLIYSYVDLQTIKTTGYMTQYMMGGTIIFGCRNGLLSFIFGISIERAIVWHKFMAWITLFMSINHWINSQYAAQFHGYIIQTIIILFFLTSFHPIRRYFWEIFKKIHWILIILLIIGCILHQAYLGLYTACYFALDVLYRIYTIIKHRHISSSMKISKIGKNIVKISMKKASLSYSSGQYFFIMIPKLSYFQWHPFSTFSASYEDEIIFYVKNLGDWTSLLYDIAGEEDNPITLKGYLDGPYGYQSISIKGDKYQNFLCICGGIGVSPIISIAKEILHQAQLGRPVKNLLFVWTGRDSAFFDSVIKPGELQNMLSQNDIQIVKTFYLNSQKQDKKIIDIETQVKDRQSINQQTQPKSDFQLYFDLSFKAALISGQNLVAVLTCGPQKLVNDIEIHSQNWSKNGVRFDVHQEIFNF